MRPEIWCDAKSCGTSATHAAYWHSSSEGAGPISAALCAGHRFRRFPGYRYDYDLPLVLAEVGDECWVAMECAWITLARMRGES